MNFALKIQKPRVDITVTLLTENAMENKSLKTASHNLRVALIPVLRRHFNPEILVSSVLSPHPLVAPTREILRGSKYLTLTITCPLDKVKMTKKIINEEAKKKSLKFIDKIPKLSLS